MGGEIVIQVSERMRSLIAMFIGNEFELFVMMAEKNGFSEEECEQLWDLLARG